MSEELIILFYYLFGWAILSIGYYAYNVSTDKRVNKKIHGWRSFWVGIWSWFGIIFILVFCIVGMIFYIDEWVENKLR